MRTKHNVHHIWIEMEKSVLKLVSAIMSLTWPYMHQWNPDSKVHGANMRPIWGRQDPGGPHVGPMNFAIWEIICMEMEISISGAGSDSSPVWQHFCLNGKCRTLSAGWLQFEFMDGYEMTLVAFRSMEEVPCCFLRSSVKCQGHTGWKIDLDLI